MTTRDSKAGDSPANVDRSADAGPAGDEAIGRHIYIFDTTLRDGEQSPGCSMNIEEKASVAKILDDMGVDIIEGGFPISSNGDFEAVRTIAQQTKSAQVAGLARARPGDIERAWEALQHARRPRIHTFLSTSPLHMKYKLQMEPEDVYQAVVDSVSYARRLCDNVEWSPEDGTRTEHDFLCRCVEAAIKAGATTINIPDTVGYTVPEEFHDLIAMLRNRVPNIDKAIISVHCHNDLGLAVANSLAAIRAGARQVECTVNGIGERAGNAALEELVMALATRRDFYAAYTTSINTKKIYPTSRMVSHLTGLYVQRNKAIVGENAFAHEAGIHQDGMLKERTTYEIMDPRDIGIPESKLVLGKHSGRHAFSQRVRELGYQVDESTMQNAFEAFKTLADKKKDVYDEDIEAILDEQLQTDRQLWELVRFQVTSGTGVISTATVMLRDSAGTEAMDAATGDGPIDAVYSAIQRITGVGVTLEDYQSRAVTGGKDAQGEVSIQARHNDRTVRGRGLSTDVVEAAAKAYIAAINRIKTVEAAANGNGAKAGDDTIVTRP